MISVHTWRNIVIVGRKIWVCFPNLLLINYVTFENLFRFLFLSCRMRMAKKLSRPNVVAQKTESTTSSRSYLAFSYGAFFIPRVRINYVFLFAQTDQLLFSIYFILSLTQLIFMSLLTWLVSALKARTVFFKVLNTFYMSYIYHY